MKQLLYILSFLGVLTVFGQQDSNDCLSPTALSNFGVLKTYEKKIDEILLSQLSDFQLIQYRQSETIWSVELDSTSNLKNPTKYNITYVRPSKSIWYSLPNIDDIVVIKILKSIKSEDYKLIKSLFDSALNSVCANCHNFGIDGATYNFSTGQISGKVWLGMQPTPNTKKERLVLLCNEVTKAITDANSKQVQLSDSLKTEIKTLSEEFKKQNANRR